MYKTYTTSEITQFAIVLRDLMFPRNGRAFHTLKRYDQQRYIKGAVRVLSYLDSKRSSL